MQAELASSMPVSEIHILLVEDDEEFRELLLGLLQEEGYRVTGVDTGEGAIQAAGEHKIDLVIADVKLGGMDGLDALSAIKGHQSELQSLVMTGYSTEADSIRAVKLGVGNYLKKPFTIADFLKAVEDLAHQILEERRVKERELALLETVSWAFQMLLVQDGVEGCEEIVRRTRRAAAHSGLGETASAHVELAALAAVVKERAETEDRPFLLKGLPMQVTALLDSYQLGASTEDQLVRYAAGLLENRRERISQTVLQAFSDEKLAEQKQRSLLPLGLALERSGDFQGAERVFSELLDSSHRRSELVGAKLGRARILFARGKAGDSLSELESVIESELGSPHAMDATLEKGILLARMGRREPALEALKKAGEAFSQMNDSLGLARAKLASIALGQGDPKEVETLVNLLLQPPHLEAFFASAAWLFPFLLRYQQETAERGLKRYFRDLPGFVSNWVRQSRSSKQVLAALQHLQKVGLSQYEELLAELAQGSDPEIGKLARHLLSNQSKDSAPPSLRLYAMGDFEAFVGDQRVTGGRWRGQKAIHLLCFLALRLGEFVPREVLVEHFWPEAGERGFKNLSQLLVVIRKALQPQDWPDNLHYIAREGSGLGIDPNVFCWHDAGEIQACLRRAAELPENSGAQELTRAFELYRGPYLSGCYMDWAVQFRRDLDRRLVEAGLQLAEVRLAQESFQEAAEVSDTLLELDPLCQLAYLAGMRAYQGMGRPEQAIRMFEQCEKVLQRELELEPSTDLLRAYHQAKLAL